MLVISLARRDDKKEPERENEIELGCVCVGCGCSKYKDTYDYNYDKKVIEYLKEREEWYVLQKGSLF